MRFVKKTLEIIGVMPVYFYRVVIRPFKPRSCAFYPTCSGYAIEAIKKHGIFVGWGLALARLSRCRPWGRRNHGYDPVPWRLSGRAKWIV